MLFTRDDLLRVLHGLNPWWRGRVPVLPPFRRPIQRTCRRHVDGSSELSVLLVSGLRGTGKTTMLLQLATDLVRAGTEPRSILYLDVGHPIFGRIPLPQILHLYREMVHPGDRSAVLLLDEMQYARDGDQHVKALFLSRTGYRIVATESVQEIERSLVSETQHFRWSAISSPTLSFHEYLTLRGLDPLKGGSAIDLRNPARIEEGELAAAARAVRPALGDFGAYLTGGGLPRPASQHGQADAGRMLPEDAVENILRRDIAVHFGARSVEDLKRLFVFLCMRTGDVFPIQRYARTTEVSAATVASHLEIRERCFLVRRVAPSGPGSDAVQKARSRVFVSDTTVRSAQLLREEESLTDPEELQRVVSTAILRHVVESFGRTLAGFRYWRDPHGRGRVDLVAREAAGQTVYHVVGERSKALKRSDPVVAFCRKEPVVRAFLVTPDADDVGVFRLPGIETTFVRLPAHLLTYLLGHAECRAASR